MEIIYYLLAHQTIYLLSIAILSLCIGSFLNVVIYRLPIMMKREWHNECLEFLELPQVEEQATEPFNLFIPRSQCPHCKHTLRFWENIPILSYLFLRGKCSHCQTHISLRYPLIELLTAMTSIFVAWYLGLTVQTIFALIFTWALISITLIDLKHQFIPDGITLSILWLGLLLNMFGMFASLNDAIIGAVVGYLSLLFFATTFKLITGKEGMGNGDFKLFAMLGAWMGWQYLPFIIISSSVVGATIGILLIIFKNFKRNTPIPFGPYLAIAGWIAFFWGETIINTYLHYAGIR